MGTVEAMAGDDYDGDAPLRTDHAQRLKQDTALTVSDLIEFQKIAGSYVKGGTKSYFDTACLVATNKVLGYKEQEAAQSHVSYSSSSLSVRDSLSLQDLPKTVAELAERKSVFIEAGRTWLDPNAKEPDSTKRDEKFSARFDQAMEAISVNLTKGR